MAKVPSAEQLPDVSPGRDPGLRLPDAVIADAYGHDVTTAAARFGAVGATLLGDLAKDRQHQEDSAFYSTAQTRLRVRVGDMERALKQEIGTGAPNYAKTFQERYQKLSDDVEKEVAGELAGSNTAKTAYRQRAAEMGATFIGQAALYEDGERKKLFADKLQQNVNDIGIAAYKGEMTREDALRQVGQVLADGRTSLLPDEFRDMEAKAKRIVSTSYLNGIAERDPQAALGIIKNTKATELAGWGLQPADIDRADNKARSELKRRAAEGRALAAIEKATLRENAAGLVKNFMAGLEVPPAALTDSSIRLRAMGDEKTANTLDMFEGMSADLKIARRGSVNDFAAMARETRELAARNPEDEKAGLRAQITDELFKSHVKQLEADPLAYGVRLFSKEIGEVPPINLDTPDLARESLKARQGAANMISNRLGIYVPPVFADEAAGIKQRFDSAESETATLPLRREIDQALGPNNQRFWAMIADGNDKQRSAEAGRLASLASLARTNPSVAVSITLGREALKADKNYAPQDTPTVRGFLDKRFGNVFTQMPPAAREAAENEIISIYAAESYAAFDKTGQFTAKHEARMTAAFQKRFGAELPTQSDGTKIIPPVYGWDGDRWNTYLKSLLPIDLGLGMKPDNKSAALPVLPSVKREVSPELIARNGVFQNVGDGRYIVRLNGEYLVDPRNGSKWIFDHSKVGDGGVDRDSQRRPPR